MKRSFVRLGILGFAAMAFAAASAHADPVLTAGAAENPTLNGAVRYRQFTNTNASAAGGPEIQVGTPSGDLITNAATGEVGWTFSRAISFSYDPTTGNLTGGVGGPVVSVVKPVTPPGALLPLNYVEIAIKKNTPTNSVALNAISLNGYALGNVSLTTGSTTVKWAITGLDLPGGFSLTGQLNVQGASGGGDSNFVQISVGYVTPPDSVGPVTSNVVVQPHPVILNGSATVTATVDDSTKGGNTIGSAHYRVDGGAILGMSAQDDLFDEVSEDVEGTFTATDIGTREVCVHGTDSLNNVGEPTCQSFLVTYEFDGFFSPIENGLVNVAKAGQAIPAKWRLTDANETPIDDPASFAGFFSYPVACDTLQGTISDSVEEYASGSSGLQYNGDGYWQFNWKTPKDYANTCRAMYVLFNSGATSPVVIVQFKK